MGAAPSGSQRRHNLASLGSREELVTGAPPPQAATLFLQQMGLGVLGRKHCGLWGSSGGQCAPSVPSLRGDGRAGGRQGQQPWARHALGLPLWLRVEGQDAAPAGWTVSPAGGVWLKDTESGQSCETPRWSRCSVAAAAALTFLISGVGSHFHLALGPTHSAGGPDIRVHGVRPHRFRLRELRTPSSVPARQGGRLREQVGFVLGKRPHAGNFARAAPAQGRWPARESHSPGHTRAKGSRAPPPTHQPREQHCFPGSWPSDTDWVICERPQRRQEGVGRSEQVAGVPVWPVPVRAQPLANRGSLQACFSRAWRCPEETEAFGHLWRPGGHRRGRAEPLMRSPASIPVSRSSLGSPAGPLPTA